MHIKFILPRFHTNMFYPTKILLENNYKISIDCSFKGFNENYSYLKPKIISESFISKFIKILIGSKKNKMNKYYLPNLILYMQYFKNNLPDVIIIRPYNTLFFLYVLLLCLIFNKKIIIYNQINIEDYKNFKITKKMFYKIFTNIFKIKIVSPLFIKSKMPKNYYLLPFIYEKNYKKKERIYDFLLVGKLYKKKNFPLFLKAIGELKKKYKVKIVTEISNEEHKEEYKKIIELIKFYKLERYISISKNVNHKKINNFYDMSKCFVLATDKDLAPVSIIEALSRGCYVLSSNSCGTNNYFTNNKNGFIFITNNLNSLKLNIKKVSKIYHKKIIQYNYDKKFFINNFNKIVKN